MNLSEPFIRRPVATSLLAIALLLAGGAAYTRLPVAPLPRIDFPTINVSASLPGASPETMASAVATPLERRFGRIAGLSEMTSVSSLGQTSITLQFSIDKDVDAAARDVQAAINAAAGDLPGNLPARPRFRKVNPADAPVLILAVTSATLPPGQLYDLASSILAQKISRIEGVGQVVVAGAQPPAVRVQVDPHALAGAGFGLEDVRHLLEQATVDRPIGQLAGPERAFSLAANDQLLRAAEFRPLVLPSRGGSPLRLADVAHVVDGVENVRSAGWVDGKPAIPLLIRRQPGANIIEVIDRVKALLPELRQSIPPAADLNIALDLSTTIRASVRDVEQTLGLSVLLVVLVVFLFLRSGRATLIPSVVVPLSLVATFGAMFLLGYSLDNLSLMALTISTGFVVDDAIVVTENISRAIEAGAPPLRAALEGARQIGFTIVSITASLLAVFIPILLMGGIVGRLFREFAVTLCVAIGISALVSLTLTPMMAARLLRPAEPGRTGPASVRQGRLLHAYDSALGWALDHPSSMLGMTAAALLLTAVLSAVVPKGLFPQQDTGIILGTTDGPEEVSFAAMKERQLRIDQVIRAHPAVDHAISVLGGPNSTINTGTVFVQLAPRQKRARSVDQVIADLTSALADVPGIKLYMQSWQDLRVGGRTARTQYQYTLQDANLEELNRWAPRLLARLQALPELRDVASDQQTGALRLDVNIDRDGAARLGITPQAVDEALYDAFGQRQVATMFTELDQYRVILEVLPRYQGGPEALDHVFLTSSAGAQVPLSAIARSSISRTALSVSHQGQFPAVTLSFNLAPGSSLGQALDAIRRAQAQIGLPAGIQTAPQGTAEAFVASLRSEPWLILAALLAVYIVLGVLYESTVHPVTILSTLPSAGVGALLALFVCRTELSIIALIGVILLIGIVKKNAIMMIDFAIVLEREQGLPAREAIHRACLMRLRPILMTTLAALLGAVPLALGTGDGSELRRPLGITLVGGLLFSQLLTLFTTPVIYVALDRLTRPRRPPPAGARP